MTNYPPEIRLSYSTMNTFLSCPRKFQLARLNNPLLLDQGRYESIDTTVGNAIHTGLQSWLQHRDHARAVCEAWIKYQPWLEEDKHTKNWHTLVDGLEQLILRFESSPWRLWGDKIEYSFRIDLAHSAEHYYCGFMDAVLEHKDTGDIAVLEAKTTGKKFQDIRPMYYNSEQALGNSIVLDSLIPEHSSFYVVYPVVQFISKNITKTHLFEFEKTRIDRLEWLQSLAYDYDQIIQYLTGKLFPKRGGKCLAYSRPCPYFMSCDAIPEEWSEPKPQVDWDVRFTINELIERQIQ